MLEIVLVGIHARAVYGGDPQASARIAHHIFNLVVRKTEGIVGAEILVIFVHVIFVQPAESTHPYMALCILDNRVYHFVGKVIGNDRTFHAARFASGIVARA